MKPREETINELAKKLRNGGNAYSTYRMILFTDEELKSFADAIDPPPRFDEKQMALLKGLYAVGARKMIYHPDVDHRWIKFEREDRTLVACVEMQALGYSDTNGAHEHTNLADLFGEKKE